MRFAAVGFLLAALLLAGCLDVRDPQIAADDAVVPAVAASEAWAFAPANPSGDTALRVVVEGRGACEIAGKVKGHRAATGPEYYLARENDPEDHLSIHQGAPVWGMGGGVGYGYSGDTFVASSSHHFDLDGNETWVLYGRQIDPSVQLRGDPFALEIECDNPVRVTRSLLAGTSEAWSLRDGTLPLVGEVHATDHAAAGRAWDSEANQTLLMLHAYGHTFGDARVTVQHPGDVVTRELAANDADGHWYGEAFSAGAGTYTVDVEGLTAGEGRAFGFFGAFQHEVAPLADHGE